MEGMIRRVKVNALLFVALLISTIVIAAVRNSNENTKSVSEKNEKLELPRLLSNQPEKIVEHLGYTVSFNTNWLIPNWVAYELTAEEVAGVEPRGNNFVPDPEIYQSPSSDEYKNSGYDRGHMAPAADMKWSKQAMEESFYTSNICPQNHNLNGGDWKDLEEHVRAMATKYDHVFVVCGPFVSLKPKHIGYNQEIAVPDAFFKAIIRKHDDTWSALGFMMPNKAGHKNLSSYAMSIEELEIIIGMDLFYNLPDDIEEQVEKTFNLTDWNL